MLKDCVEFTKGCQECQVHSSIQHVPASELYSIVKPWPFRRWALDIIGEIWPTSSKGQRYILVGIDYFTKWVEAIPLVNVDQEAVVEFIQNHIIYVRCKIEVILASISRAFSVVFVVFYR